MRYFTILLLSTTLFGIPSAFAKDRSTKNTAHTETKTLDDLSPESQSWGLGFSTAMVSTLNQPAVTGWFDLSNYNSIQTFFTIPSTNPFSFALSGVYKHTIAGGYESGFHIGGGLTLGSMGTHTPGESASFVADLIGIAGIHFHIPSVHHVMLNFDGGPVLNLVKDNNSFSVGTFSPFLGASIIYVFD